MTISSRHNPIPNSTSDRFAVPPIKPRTVPTAILIGFRLTIVPIHLGMVEESTKIVLAKSNGYTKNMLEPDTVSGRFAKIPIMEKIQLTLKAKKMIYKTASVAPTIPLLPSSG